MSFRLRPDGKLYLTENDVELRLLDVLGRHRYFALRQQSGVFATLDSLCSACKKSARRVTVGESGLPDYVIPACCIEAKGHGGRLRADQKTKIGHLQWFFAVDTLVVDPETEPDQILKFVSDRVKR